MCLPLLLFLFHFFFFFLFYVYWHEFEIFADFKLRTLFHHQVTHNNTHAQTRLLTRERCQKRKANNGKHWLISISPNDDDEKQNTVLCYIGLNGDYITRLKNFFSLSPVYDCKEKKWEAPQDIFLSWNWVMQFLDDIEWREHDIDEIRFKTKMKIESDLWK